MIDETPDAELQRSGRNADSTRRALVRAALRRFATQGYRATTVRQIAADAGVNVALINRYFVSKEGLFEACMSRTSTQLSGPPRAANLDEVIERLIAHVVNSPDGDDPLQMLLLLRSSGDDNANRIRRRTLENYTQRLAASAGWSPGHPDADALLLRTQVALAAMLGTMMLRASAAAEPVASASADELAVSLRDVLRVLLRG